MDRPLTIVIPVYNEGANFPGLWSEMKQHLDFPFAALVAYDFDGDDTLPVADGWMEIGTHVPIDQLRDAMEDWFRRKSYLPRDSNLLLTVS